MVADQQHAAILSALTAIEAEHGVRILYACESGSRGWGFASPDSDYDARLLYVHPLPWYLRVRPQRDVIERCCCRQPNRWRHLRILNEQPPTLGHPLCIYHADCLDGFSGAWVVNEAHMQTGLELSPGVHQQPPPEVRGREVILVDFSYKRDVLLAMADAAQRILILDHHQSAQADLVDLPDNVTTIFDMDRCGAMIAWSHYFPDRRPPLLLEHIQDRDLWRFALPGTREITATLASYPFSLIEWNRLMHENTEALREEGIPILRQHDKDVRELVESLAYRSQIAGHEVPVINAPAKYSSDVGAALCGGEPFAACYWDTPEGRRFSLRSDAQGLDVSQVAANFGGGGHRHAAGFLLERRTPLQLA